MYELAADLFPFSRLLACLLLTSMLVACADFVSLRPESAPIAVAGNAVSTDQGPGGQPQGQGRQAAGQDQGDVLDETETLGAPGSGTIAFRLGYFDMDDPGGAAGNPFLDETLQVIEPVLYFDYNTSDTTKVWTRLQYDNVSAASIERLSNFPQQSGATGDYYLGAEIGVTHQTSVDSQAGGFVHGSVEYDYQSLGLGAHISQDYDEANTTLRAGFSTFYDTLDIIRFNGQNEGTDNRFSLNLSTDWYQVINIDTHSEVGLSFTYQNGFLETPYNAVVIENPLLPPNPNLANMARGIEVTEELPDDRFRLALYGRIRQSLSERWAAQLGGRLYGDDWDIFSFAVSPSVFTWVVQDALRAHLRYRFYTQTEARYFNEMFTVAPELRTQDSDLAAFDSHTFGFRFDWYSSDNTTLDIGFDYTLRSDDLDFFFTSIGAVHRFRP